MSDYPMLISNKLHSFRNFMPQKYEFSFNKTPLCLIGFIYRLIGKIYFVP